MQYYKVMLFYGDILYMDTYMYTRVAFYISGFSNPSVAIYQLTDLS